MRMRKKKNGSRRLLACGALFAFPLKAGAATLADADLPGTIEPSMFEITPTAPGKLLGRAEYPRYALEIGCGKGAFVRGMARRAPDCGFIAMERVADVLTIAMEHAAAEQLPNARFILGDAGALDEYFPPHAFDVIYLNFSDPWPKRDQLERRLTYRAYLEIYRRHLAPGGCIAFKTDNAALFEFSKKEFKACGFGLSAVTDDLHGPEWAGWAAERDVQTEYEAMWAARGAKIHRLEARG